MHRRRFIQLIGGAAAIRPTLAFAQPASMPTIGFVSNGSPRGFVALLGKFRQGLGEVGFGDGQVIVEARWAEGRDDRLPGLISELVQRRVSVIATTGGSRATMVAQAITTSVPVVFVMGADPVKLGLVKSLNKPGGNLTGVSLLSNGLLAKQIAILHEAISSGGAIGFLVRAANPNANNDTKEVVAAAEALGHTLVVAKVDAEDEIAPAISDLARKKVEGLVIFPDVLFISNMTELVTHVTHHRLPAIYNFREFATGGGLLCYGGNQNEAYRQAGIYTGRILKGEKPSELPVMQSARFELIVNLKTAKAFGMTLSPTLLATADEVIE